jgi:2'-5' RNA ligase
LKLFYSIPLSDNARKTLKRKQEDLRESKTKMKLVEPENLHITLTFIGEVNNIQYHKKILDSVPRGTFNISLSAMGAFPNKEHAKIVWAGVKPEENIINIHEVICNQLESQEKGYRPHITLARLKSEADNVVKRVLAKQLNTPFKISCVQLLKSTLLPTGPKYEVIHEVML